MIWQIPIHKYGHCDSLVYHLLISLSSKDFVKAYVFINIHEIYVFIYNTHKNSISYFLLIIVSQLCSLIQ